MPRVTGGTNSDNGILAVTLTFRIVEALAANPSALGVTENSQLHARPRRASTAIS